MCYILLENLFYVFKKKKNSLIFFLIHIPYSNASASHLNSETCFDAYKIAKIHRALLN